MEEKSWEKDPPEVVNRNEEPNLIKRDNIREYQINAPLLLNEDQKIYNVILEDQIKKDEVKNVGIIAPFSGGKSSIIKAYTETYSRTEPKTHKYINISLATFSANFDEKPNKLELDYILLKEERIKLAEKSILEQLLFKVDKNEVPRSKIERIEEKPLSYLGSFLLLVSAFLFTLYSFLTFYSVEPFDCKWLNRVYFPCAVFYTACAMAYLLRNFKITRVSIKNIEVSFESVGNGSVLNMFIDEIIYFFKKTKIRIVVFEDIDRLGCIELFEKLREINQIINRDYKKKQVTFIYAVKDSLFKDSEQRSKFFDFVISPIPFLHSENISDHIEEILKRCSKDVSLKKSFLDDISSFIKEKRTLNNTINDYFMYKDILHIHDDENEKLFAMMVFKNTFPDDYSSFIHREGELYKLLTTKKREYIKALLEKNNKKINDIDNKLSNIRDIYTKYDNFEELRTRIIGYITRYGKQVYSVSTGFVDIASTKTFIGISNFYYRFSSGYGSLYFKILSSLELEKYLGNSPSKIEETMKEKNEYKLEVEKKALLLNNSEIKNMTIKELFKSNPEFKFFEGMDTNEIELLKYCILEGYIDDTYYKYIGKGKQDNNALFKSNIKLGKETDPALMLTDASALIHNLQEARFESCSIFNYSLFDELINTKEEINKKKIFLSFLAKKDDKTVSFLGNYCLYSKYFLKLIDDFYEIYPNFVEDMLTLEMLDVYKKSELLNYLFKKDLKLCSYYNVNDSISSYIQKHPNPFSLIFNDINDFDKIDNIIHKLNLQKLVNLEMDNSFSSAQMKLLNLVLNEARFEINRNNIEILLKCIFANKHVNLSTLLTTDNEELKKYMVNHIPLLFSILLTLNYSYTDDIDILILVINSPDIDAPLKGDYLSHYKYALENDDKLNSGLMPMLFDNDVFKPIWGSFEEYINKSEGNYEPLERYINRNIDSFEGNITNSDILLVIMNHMSFEKTDTYYKICDKVRGCLVNLYDVTKDLPRSILIDKGFIEVNDIEDILKFINEKETLTSLLRKYPDYVDKILDNKIAKNVIMHIIHAKELDIDVKSKLFNAYFETILCNASSEEVDCLVMLIQDNSSYPYSFSSLDKLIESQGEEHKLKTINLVGGVLKGLGLVNFLKKYENDIFTELTKQKGILKIRSDLSENYYVIELMKENLIKVIRHGRLVTIDNTKLFDLFS